MTTFSKQESVANKLITMRKSIGQLESLGPVNGVRLESIPQIGLVAERILTLLHDLAFEINTQTAAAFLSDSPHTATAAFRAATKAGVIDAALTARFTSADEPHHTRFQLCLDIDPADAAKIACDGLSAYGQYTEQVSCWIAQG
ncbi:hypothetical protein K7711_31170 [Nocardia sp. CA2R105]|uniref:hypothetical protein n=1 Tax=Nocardia coffeae TaxID=2873381 RepID=UPI001CA64440|nr:hypothetical protein [Nocardia coffeae]MBY8860973.1 hypothetical protein [Nocardia coffeae]